MTGIERIAAERKRQIEEEGWTAEHDDQWKRGEIAAAAATYATHPFQDGAFINWRKILWPWDIEWYKPETDRIREMEKAGALCAAEIDRLQRLEGMPEDTEQAAVKTHLNILRDEAFAYAEKQGFHKRSANLGERLMLVVSELSEALEADREGKWAPTELLYPSTGEIQPITDLEITKEIYENHIRGTVEEELSDAVIRLCDIAGVYGIDLDWHVAAKMAYNRTRPYLHGKKYG